MNRSLKTCLESRISEFRSRNYSPLLVHTASIEDKLVFLEGRFQVPVVIEFGPAQVGEVQLCHYLQSEVKRAYLM